LVPAGNFPTYVHVVRGIVMLNPELGVPVITRPIPPQRFDPKQRHNTTIFHQLLTQTDVDAGISSYSPSVPHYNIITLVI